MTAQDIAVTLEQENAWLREQMAAAQSVVQTELSCACYHAETMEYGEEPCVRCVLDAFLHVPDCLILDVIAARRGAA